ncbi:MAG TPA: hypothetical protein VF513_16605 [Stenotrophomonas sp.]
MIHLLRGLRRSYKAGLQLSIVGAALAARLAMPKLWKTVPSDDPPVSRLTPLPQDSWHPRRRDTAKTTN